MNDYTKALINHQYKALQDGFDYQVEQFALHHKRGQEAMAKMVEYSRNMSSLLESLHGGQQA